jgi:hypothetical protein
VLFTLTGCLMALNGIAANTMLQLQSPDHLRGRVMGFYSFTVLGMAPFGSLQAGGCRSISSSDGLALGGGVRGGGGGDRVGMGVEVEGRGSRVSVAG